VKRGCDSGCRRSGDENQTTIYLIKEKLKSRWLFSAPKLVLLKSAGNLNDYHFQPYLDGKRITADRNSLKKHVASLWKN
jgi:hypothetical protein